MISWFPLFNETIQPSSGQESGLTQYYVQVPAGVSALRVRCWYDRDDLSDDALSTALDAYFDHESITPTQRETLTVEPAERQSISGIDLHDPAGVFRGRWDSSFNEWKTLSAQSTDDGFIAGDIMPGEWQLLIANVQTPLAAFAIHIEIEGSEQADNAVPDEPSYVLPEDEPIDEEAESSWRIGELSESTSRSDGARDVESTLKTYQSLDYGFVCLADAGQPPVESFSFEPGLIPIRGQRLKTPSGNALLLGARERIAPIDDEGEKSLSELIRETHIAEGLFCLSEPFSINLNSRSAWVDDPALGQVDFIEIQHGQWTRRFPETLKAFDLWDGLLQQGFNIYGCTGKGPEGALDGDLAERLLKTVVFAQADSESAILSGLKQGRFYSTVEPAVTFWAESPFGGAMIGDELRIPVQSQFLLQLRISQMQHGGYLIIKTNNGIYCQTPYSTSHETRLNFVANSTPRRQWFRVEVYQYGRPLDTLLAFTNPIFIRGIISR